mgnify:CR=1 FL=1
MYKRQDDISPIFFIGILLVSSFFINVNAADEEVVESVTIIGSKDDLKNLPGSGAVISNGIFKKQWTQTFKRF